jgi:hypothetical protein
MIQSNAVITKEIGHLPKTAIKQNESSTNDIPSPTKKCENRLRLRLVMLRLILLRLNGCSTSTRCWARDNPKAFANLRPREPTVRIDALLIIYLLDAVALGTHPGVEEIL